MKFIPNHDRILIRREKAKMMTESGLHLPEKAVEAPWEGEVLATGPETKVYATGDRVMFSKYAGVHVEVNGEKLLLVTEKEILGELLEE